MKSVAVVLTIFTSLLSVTIGFSTSDDPYNLEQVYQACKDENLMLNFSNTMIRNIAKDFIASPVITCLNLAGNSIETMEAGAFGRLPNLKFLSLAGNQILSSELLSFGNHSNLEILIASDQAGSSYSRMIYLEHSYSNLWYLDLSRNKIYDIQESNSNLVKFPALRYLNLSSNAISGNSFEELLPTTLLYLYLDDNNIQRMSMTRLENLGILTANINRFSSLCQVSGTYNRLSLSGLKNLRYLSVTQNDISLICVDAFQDTPMLEYLDLSGNSISSIQEDTFSSLKHLQTLMLDNNKLQRIPATTAPLNVIRLSMCNNDLSGLMQQNFQNYPHLKKLFLSGNLISNVTADIWLNQSALEELYLERNQLSQLPSGWCSGLKELTYLDLSSNSFKNLEALRLLQDMRLTTVNLVNNRLTNLNVTSFAYLPKNLTIKLFSESTMPDWTV